MLLKYGDDEAAMMATVEDSPELQAFSRANGVAEHRSTSLSVRLTKDNLHHSKYPFFIRTLISRNSYTQTM
ncbi:hypothetical protein Hdeb2414_s0001g00034521 [Helianthus debilis subsp. tardiflorus]